MSIFESPTCRCKGLTPGEVDPKLIPGPVTASSSRLIAIGHVEWAKAFKTLSIFLRSGAGRLPEGVSEMALIGKPHFEANVYERHRAFGEQTLGLFNPFVHNVFMRGTSSTLAKQICEMLRTHLHESGQVS